MSLMNRPLLKWFEREDGKRIIINPNHVRCVTSEIPGLCRVYFDDSAKAMPVKGTIEEIMDKLLADSHLGDDE